MSIAPGDGRVLQADAEEREGRLQGDVRAERDGRHDDDGRDGVRGDVAQHHPGVGGAEGAGRLHVVVLFGGDDRAAGDAGDLGPAEQDDEADDGPDGGAVDDGEEDQAAEDDGDAEEDVGEAGEDRVPPAAEETRESAEHAAEDRDAEGGADADGHRGAGAVDDPGVDVAALRVEAEGVAGFGALLGVVQVGLEGVAARDESGPDRDDHQEEDDQGGDDEDRVAPQVAPGVRPEAAGLPGGPGAVRAPRVLLQAGALLQGEVHRATGARRGDRSVR